MRFSADTKDSAYGPKRGADVALHELPPIVFSEVMRHCELFTAVASIASDPLWLDRGADANHPNQWYNHARDYWRTGKRHTYRIHLNSGAVTLQDEMRHICIVPAPTAKQKAGDIYLPFRGDQTLSLILSKAMLLAEDDRITDPVILAQL